MNDGLRIGVDIGGTFTDAVAVFPDSVRVAKVPSNPENPSQAVLAAISALNIDDPPERFLHGTTLVTNMLLERKGALTGFITSSGIRDVLHIGRHERPLTYAISQEIAQQHYPPVPRKWRHTVPERIDAKGEIVTALDEARLRTAVRELIEAGVETIAIGFLHAYRFPENERQAEAWAKEEAPNTFISLSSEVSPRFREYERFLTTAWNARVAPAAAAYLSELAEAIATRYADVCLTMMTSNGGLEEVDMSVEATVGSLRRTPIRLALSGPAAAGNATAHIARKLGFSNCVGLDVGGTSSDIVVVRGGRLHEAPVEERNVAGYPLQVPMLDLHTIGAGGGSLAYRDGFETLHIGPESAGAMPGPACYGKGGTRPTVTDAAVIVGRLPSMIKLGGIMPIQDNLAYDAFAREFDISNNEIIKTALDVLALAEANIAFAIRERTVARGLDPAELALVAAGGAGPLLACGIAEMLELAEVIIPPRSGLLAAWGLLVAPDRRESTITILQPVSELSQEAIQSFFDKAFEGLSQEPPEEAEYLFTAALRYLGQGFEVDVPITQEDSIAQITERFHKAHDHEYGFALEDAPLEWVELRVAWEYPATTWEFPKLSGGDQSSNDIEIWELVATRSGHLDREVVNSHATVLNGQDLQNGAVLEGPVIILEQDTTVYAPTGWQVNVMDGGYLRIKHNG